MYSIHNLNLNIYYISFVDDRVANHYLVRVTKLRREEEEELNAGMAAITQLMEKCKWEMFDYLPYSPDVAPSNFHLLVLAG